MCQLTEENVSSLKKHLSGYRKSDGALMYDEYFFLPRFPKLDEEPALLSLVSYGECTWYPGCIVHDDVQAPNVSLSLCTTGACKIQQEAHPSVIQHSGELVVYKKLKTETLRTHGSDIFRKKVLILNRTIFLNGLFDILFPEDITLIHLREPLVIEQVFAHILESIRSGQVTAKELSIELFRLLQEVHAQIASTRFSPKLEQAIRIIYAEPKFRINRESLAQLCNTSVSSLNRMFQEELHCPPAQYIQRVRMECACRYLIGTKMLIKQIAEECGFINSKHFAAEFHRYYGVTPSQYRTGETGKPLT